jgi:hypothetical protein
VKLFDYRKNEDWGKDYYFTFLKGRKYSLLQASFSVCEYPSFPHIQISMGGGKLFGIFVYVWKFGADVDFVSRNWWL